MARTSETASASISKVKPVNSLSLKNCGIDSAAEGAKVVAMGLGSRIALLRVIGQAQGTNSRVSRRTKEVNTAIIGEFKGIRISDRAEFRAVRTFLLGGAHEPIQFALEAMERKNQSGHIDFAGDVYVIAVPRIGEDEYGEPYDYVGYDFEFDWLKEPPTSKALAAIEEGLPALPGA